MTRCVIFQFQLIYKIVHAVPWRTSFTNIGVPVFVNCNNNNNISSRSTLNCYIVAHDDDDYGGWGLVLWIKLFNMIFQFCQTSQHMYGGLRKRTRKKIKNQLKSTYHAREGTYSVTHSTIIKITCSKTTVRMVLSRVIVILIELTIEISRLAINAAVDGNKKK